MVTNIKILLIILINISSSLFARAQIGDSINCDQYFDWLELEEATLTTLWSQPPRLKEINMPILSELCDLIVRDSCKNMVATLIVDKSGNTVCVRANSEFASDSLKAEIVKLLHKLEFNPALRNKTSVISHYFLILNDSKCEIYKNMMTKALKEQDILKKKKNKVKSK